MSCSASGAAAGSPRAAHSGPGAVGELVLAAERAAAADGVGVAVRLALGDRLELGGHRAPSAATLRLGAAGRGALLARVPRGGCRERADGESLAGRVAGASTDAGAADAGAAGPTAARRQGTSTDYGNQHRNEQLAHAHHLRVSNRRRLRGRPAPTGREGSARPLSDRGRCDRRLRPERAFVGDGEYASEAPGSAGCTEITPQDPHRRAKYDCRPMPADLQPMAVAAAASGQYAPAAGSPRGGGGAARRRAAAGRGPDAPRDGGGRPRSGARDARRAAGRWRPGAGVRSSGACCSGTRSCAGWRVPCTTACAAGRARSATPIGPPTWTRARG